MEHGPEDTVDAEDMVRAAELAGATPLIRVTHTSPHLILRVLDSGAQSVHVPEVNTAEQARSATASRKYRPIGCRGLAGVRAAESLGPRPGFCQRPRFALYPGRGNPYES